MVTRAEKMRRRARNRTNDRQGTLELMYQRILGELCMNRFEWKGFEDTGVSTRYLEKQLYLKGLSVVFRDTPILDMTRINPVTGTHEVVRYGTNQIYAMMGGPSGAPNLVDDPTEFTVTGSTYLSRRLSNAECVPVWSNYMRIPDLDVVNIYAWKLANLDRTIEINANNARRSRILTFNENGRLTAANIQDMIDRGEGVIPVNMQMGDMVQALDMGVDPRTLEPLSVLRSRVWNECMGLLGINNSNQEKKERLVEAEVGANDDQVGSARRVNLNARQEAARLINDMFDLDVSVDYYTNMPNETVDPATNEQTGVV